MKNVQTINQDPSIATLGSQLTRLAQLSCTVEPTMTTAGHENVVIITGQINPFTPRSDQVQPHTVDPGSLRHEMPARETGSLLCVLVD